MNTLSNGALAVGAPGSLMRFQAAYEHELMKAVESKPSEYSYGIDSVPSVAARMVAALAKGNASLSPAIKRAAKACEIKPTTNGIKEYLEAAIRDIEI